MKKRALTAILMVMIMVCLTACGSKVTAEEVLEKASAKQQSMTDIDMSGKMTMNMEMSGQTIDIDMDMGIKETGLNTDEMKMAMEMKMNLLGQDMTTTTYYTDGYYYTEAMGQKSKIAMNLEELKANLENNNSLMELQTDAYKSLEMKEEGGNYVITFVADGEKMTALVDSLMGSAMSGVTGGTEGADITLEEVSGTVTIDKDFNMTAQKMKMDMSMTVEGMDIKTSIDADITINNPGQEVTIEFPADLDTYEEVAQ